MNILLQPVYVLHSRPFRDTSVIVDVLSRDFGRLSLLAKGQRGAKTRKRFNLDPFTQLSMSWQGRGELKTITVAESATPSPRLHSSSLFCALYINELIMRMLPAHDAHAELFYHYGRLLQSLARSDQVEPHLRRFELTLLNQMGYAINFLTEADTHESVVATQNYGFIPDFGFVKTARWDDFSADTTRASKKKFTEFKGKQLLAIANGDYAEAETQKAAKLLLRLALAPHLGDKPLNSRKLFQR